MKCGIKRDPAFFYFIDKNGDVSRVRVRREVLNATIKCQHRFDGLKMCALNGLACPDPSIGCKQFVRTGVWRKVKQ